MSKPDNKQLSIRVLPPRHKDTKAQGGGGKRDRERRDSEMGKYPFVPVSPSPKIPFLPSCLGVYTRGGYKI